MGFSLVEVFPKDGEKMKDPNDLDIDYDTLGSGTYRFEEDSESALDTLPEPRERGVLDYDHSTGTGQYTLNNGDRWIKTGHGREWMKIPKTAFDDAAEVIVEGIESIKDERHYSEREHAYFIAHDLLIGNLLATCDEYGVQVTHPDGRTYIEISGLNKEDAELHAGRHADSSVVVRRVTRWKES